MNELDIKISLKTFLKVFPNSTLWNFVLFGAELYVSDYNGNNHSYKYELMPVKLEGNAGTEFFVTDRGCNINLTFSDRTENDRKINC